MTRDTNTAISACKPTLPRRPIVLVAAAALVVLLMQGHQWRGPMDCRFAAREAPVGDGVGVCRDEWTATRVPKTGARLANLLRRHGELADAKALATELLATAARADALYVLGKIADAEDRVDDAKAALDAAYALHLAENAFVDAARDRLALTGPLLTEARYADAFHALAECVAYTVVLDPVVENHCHLAAVTIANTVGNFSLAERELAHAGHGMRTDADHARLHFDRGNLYQEIARAPLRETWHDQAAVEFEHALGRAVKAQRREIVDGAHLNLAHTLAERGDTASAQRHLDTVDPSTRREAERLRWEQIQANIEFRRGDLEAAWTRNARIHPRIEKLDERMDVAVMQARIALARRDFVGAEHWARLGIDAVEAHRASVPLELRPWMLASRREPYELLFVVHARSGRPIDALLAFDRWHDRTVRDSIASSVTDRGFGLLSAADATREIVGWLARLPSPAFAWVSGWLADDAAISRIDLLALVVANDEVWCLTAQAGDVRLHNLGPARSFSHEVDLLISALVLDPLPIGHALASRLGAKVLRDGIGRPTRDTLHVLIDAPLAALPLAALRVDDRPLVAARPIVRVDRIPARDCVPRDRPSRAVVLADPQGDLLYARLEATAFAATQRVPPLLGAAATADALFATPPDAALHLALHGAVDGFEVLRLYDRDVTALEISARRLGPPLVFTAVCLSGVARDGEGAGSVASSFLAAGSRHVIATMRSVTDVGAAGVTARFYRADGLLDPPRALARAQAELADTDNRDWPFFVVIGHDVCQAP